MEPTRTDDRNAFPVLVLAAGASRRLGRAKALLPLNSGTLMDHAIGQAKRLGGPVTVVSGAWYPIVRFRCRAQPSTWVIARDWCDGMSASLKAGVASLGPHAKGVFIVLLDQPLIGTESLVALGEAARGDPAQACAADINGKPGAPAYIPRRLWPQVMALEGDRGAAAVLARDGATRIAMAGAGSDVDTPADWRRIRRQLAEKP
ncbi:nucleotidyltransferase family protein [Marinobacter sp. TBZ242]|uniref:Nucleotidyltransferase family protein n=1 Tax=Marinobacter azerbaijanicus TaxID=3050455 RepID=A0ABT7I8H0_9GAMM|nr:nucleotidyltransferase family protein [Marinobacter sp. TBZ242]MDL0429990.1 nucleotidyltransferase family protein [Marinobacter sp. TBZ242]